MKRLAKRVALVLVLAMFAQPACSFGGGDSPTYKAIFALAIQVFPGVKVRVLGVNSGLVTDITNVKNGVQVTFRIDNGLKLPSNVQAAVVPSSLLGERYIQLFPAYTRGGTFRPGSTIPVSRTAVPAEPDELLASLQDYMGGLKSDSVNRFVVNAAKALQGSGDDINQLIHNASAVIATLNAKRDDLAAIIVELDKLTVALSTRQQGLARLIQTYGVVASTLNTNRAALEGTIGGLNQASLQLASLLIAHRGALHGDIKALTSTGRTLQKNEQALAETGHWATRLFKAATRAVDYQHHWLRLNNQGEPLAGLILMRLEERLMELCVAAGVPTCSVPQYWSLKVPELFCFKSKCPKGSPGAPIGTTLANALTASPQLNALLSVRAASRNSSVQHLVEDLLAQTVGNTNMFSAADSPVLTGATP